MRNWRLKITEIVLQQLKTALRWYFVEDDVDRDRIACLFMC